MGYAARINRSAEKRRILKELSMDDLNRGDFHYTARAVVILQEQPQLPLPPTAPLGARNLGAPLSGITIEGHGSGASPQEAATEAIKNMQLRLQAPLATRRELADLVATHAREVAEEKAKSADTDAGNEALDASLADDAGNDE